MKRFSLPAAAAAALVSAPLVVAAQDASSAGAHSKARLVSGWAEGDGQRVAGLKIRLEPGWKTYWP